MEITPKAFFELQVGDYDYAWRRSKNEAELQRHLIGRALGLSYPDVRTELDWDETMEARAWLAAAFIPYKFRCVSEPSKKFGKLHKVFRCDCPPCGCMQCGLQIGCEDCQCDHELLAEFPKPNYGMLEDSFIERPQAKEIQRSDVALVGNLIMECGYEMLDFMDWELRRFQTILAAIFASGNVLPLSPPETDETTSSLPSEPTIS